MNFSVRLFIACFAIKELGLPRVRTVRGVVSEQSAGGRTTMTLLRERGRSDGNDARAFLLRNTG
jgi:hypothetical protein